MDNRKQHIAAFIEFIILAAGIYLWVKGLIEYIPFAAAAAVFFLPVMDESWENYNKYGFIWIFDILAVLVYTVCGFDIFGLSIDGKVKFILSVFLAAGAALAVFALVRNITNKLHCTYTVKAKHTRTGSYEKDPYERCNRYFEDDAGHRYLNVNITHEYEYKYNEKIYRFKVQGSHKESYSDYSAGNGSDIVVNEETTSPQTWYENIKINPKNPKEYRLKTTNFNYNFILLASLAGAVVSFLLLRLL